MCLICFAPASFAQLTPLGTGATAGVNDWVYSLKTDTVSDLLYVGGDFTTAGSVFSPFIASWNGADWSTLGTGLDGAARTMLMFEGDLIVGGEFTLAGGITVNRIAKWDGTNWSAMGDGFDNNVLSLCIFNNQLYAGGIFTTSGATPTKGLAKWNGTEWEEVGGGLTASSSFDDYTVGVVSMIVVQNQLYVGGYFDLGDNGQETFDGNLVRWNGFSWQDIPSSFGYSNKLVWTLKERDGLLWAGGVGSPYVRTYDGINWLTGSLSPLPQYTVNGDVYVLDFYDGFHIVGGAFTGVGVNQFGTGPQFEDETINAIQNEEWFSLDGGVNNTTLCTEEYQNQLYIGGSFTRINNGFVQCNHIARWASPLEIEFDKQNPMCQGVSNGSVTLTPTNGAPPYTYNWNDIGLASNTRTALPDGVYNCTITDAIGRVSTRTITLNSPTVLDFNFSVTNSTGTDGEITLTVTGGAMPYEYEWNTGETTATISNLPNGQYTVTVEDDNGCIETESVTVTLINGVRDAQEQGWVIYPNPTTDRIRISNQNASDNAYTATVFNMLGMKIAEHVWTASGTTNAVIDLSSLSAGTYMVTIANKQGAYIYRQQLMKK